MGKPQCEKPDTDDDIPDEFRRRNPNRGRGKLQVTCRFYPPNNQFGYRQFGNGYTIGDLRRCTAGIMVERNGLLIHYLVLKQICKKAQEARVFLSPYDWDGIYDAIGTTECRPRRAESPNEPTRNCPAPTPPPDPNCPPPVSPPPSPAQLFVERDFEPAGWKKLLFGEEPARIRVYFCNPDERELAQQMLRRAYLKHAIGELRSDIDAGITVADVTARVVFGNVDDVEAAINVCQKPSLANCASMLIVVLGGVKLYRSADDLGGGGGLTPTYEPSPKHGGKPRRTGKGVSNPAPTNGQAALDNSIQIKPSSTRRIGVDPGTKEIVVFDETHPCKAIFHGHVRSWDELTPEMKKALERVSKLLNL